MVRLKPSTMDATYKPQRFSDDAPLTIDYDWPKSRMPPA
jgi:hypothetical protein